MVPEVRILLVPHMDTLKVHHFKDSSVLDMCLWDTEKNDLMVVFKSKAAWVYKKVPENVYDNFITAESSGKFFNENIRNAYASLCLFKEGSTVV
jgi:hypothetical protein